LPMFALINKRHKRTTRHLTRRIAVLSATSTTAGHATSTIFLYARIFGIEGERLNTVQTKQQKNIFSFKQYLTILTKAHVGNPVYWGLNFVKDHFTCIRKLVWSIISLWYVVFLLTFHIIKFIFSSFQSQE
jgi:hypothetical protein